MFYFPVVRGIWPEWVPFVGGQFYLFFKPVFNVADVSISIGVLNVLVFQRRYFLSELERIEVEAEKATLDNQKEEE